MEVYARVRRAVQVDGMSMRQPTAPDASSRRAARTARTPAPPAPGQNVQFECQILGVKAALQLPKPHVEMEIRLFHQGESAPVYDSQVLAVPSSTLAHNLLVGQVSIETNLEPGEYAMQLVAYDRLAPRNRQTATQWTRFSVVK